MSFHWQHSAVSKVFNEFENKTKEEIKDKLTETRFKLKEAEQKAIDYHGNLENCTHGFFAGNIFYYNLLKSALETILGLK